MITDAVSNFNGLSGVGRILAVGWYLQALKQKDVFTAEDLRASFRAAQYEPPDLSVYLPRMAAKKPPQIVKAKGGFRLEVGLFRRLSSKYGEMPSTVTVSALLIRLPERVPSVVEREFLRETLACYRIKAYRAAIVMAWNLAFDHLCQWILIEPIRLAAFNAALQAKEPKKQAITVRTDFDELKESTIIELGRAAKIIPKNIGAILSEKLNKRNRAAHPSSIAIGQAQVDEIIIDLVDNVLLTLT